MYISYSENILFFFVIIIQVLNILSSTISSVSSLYASKDNPILLSLPAYHEEVYYSKLCVSFINEFIKNLTTTLPLFLSYALLNGVGVYFYIISAIMLVVLPLLSTLIGSLLSIPLMYILKLFKRVGILAPIVIVAFLVGLYFAINSVLALLPDVIRLKAMYIAVARAINDTVALVSDNSLWYVWVRDIVFAHNNLSILWLALLIVGLFVLNFFLSKPLFFRLASSSMEHAVNKNHKVTKEKQHSTYSAFFKKELLLSVRNIGEVIGEYSLILFLPFMLYVVDGLIFRLSLNDMGVYITIAINVIISLIFILGSNQSSATSLSKEGSEFVILKTAPSKTYLVCWAKMTTNAIVSVVLIIISLLILNSFKVLNPCLLLELGLIYILIDISHMLLSMTYDIKRPFMREYAATGKYDENPNVSRSNLSGLLLAFATGIMVFVAFYVSKVDVSLITNIEANIGNVFNATLTPFTILIAMCTVVLGINFYMFDLNIKCLFQKIEF